MRAARAATHKPPAPPSIILHVFNRLLTALAALSFALAVAVAIVWCIYSDARATNVQDPSIYNDPDWQNVTPRFGLRHGDSVYDLSLTQAGIKLSCFEAVDPNRPLFELAYLEHFYTVIVLFLVLPIVWLTPRRWVRGRFVHTADREPAAMPPDHWQWAIKSLLVGILGLPIYIAAVDLCAWLTGPIAKAPGLLEAIQIGFFVGFPPCCLAFAHKERWRWRGNSVGVAGEYLTVVWFAIWVVLFFLSLAAA
jgi:hypothetical protein